MERKTCLPTWPWNILLLWLGLLFVHQSNANTHLRGQLVDGPFLNQIVDVHFLSAMVKNRYQCHRLCVVSAHYKSSDFSVQNRTCHLYSFLELDGAGLRSDPGAVHQVTDKLDKQNGVKGVKAVELNGTVYCKIQHAAPGVTASARCCKKAGMGCEYLYKGPSEPRNDARTTVTCYKGFSPLGVITTAMCCKAPGLSCKVIRPTRPSIADGKIMVKCPHGQVLTGCVAQNWWRQAH